MEWILVIVIRHNIFFEKIGKWELLFIIYNVLYVIACKDHIKTGL